MPGGGAGGQNLGAVYNVNVSSLKFISLQTIIGMYSYIVHRYPLGFAFIFNVTKSWLPSPGVGLEVKI